MRRIVAVVLLSLSLGLVAAAPPKSSPKPSPTPAPTATLATAAPSAAPHGPTPVVVVYPFAVTGDVKPETGQQAAQLFAQVMQQAGGLTVINGGADIKRTDYATNAQKFGADYYLTGYMNVLGDSIALVEQLVAMSSGTIVYKTTVNIQSYPDATSSAHDMHDLIVAREQSLAAAIDATPEPAATATQPGNQASVNLSDLGSILHRRGRTTPTPGPTPTPQKPDKGILVAHISGALTSSELSQGTATLFYALNSHYRAQMVSAAAPAVAKTADGICGTNRNNTIASGDATTQSVRHGLGNRTQYTFTLKVYTCFGALLAQSNATADTLGSAISAAVADYATNHPQNG